MDQDKLVDAPTPPEEHSITPKVPLLTASVLPAGSWRLPPATLGLVTAIGALYIWTALRSDLDPETGAHLLLMSGAKINEMVVGGEWWRILSAGFLHGTSTHLAFNLLGISLLGSFHERTFGSPATFATAVLGSAAGMAASVGASALPSIGASAMMYSLLGASIIAALLRPAALTGFRALITLVVPASLGVGAMLYGTIAGSGFHHQDLAGLGLGALAAGLVAALRPYKVAVQCGRMAVIVALIATGFALAQTALRLIQPSVSVGHQVTVATPQGLPPFLVPTGWKPGSFAEGACEVGVEPPPGSPSCYVDPFHAVLVVGPRTRLERTPVGVAAAAQESNSNTRTGVDDVLWHVDPGRDIAFALLAYHEWASDYSLLFAALLIDPAHVPGLPAPEPN